MKIKVKTTRNILWLTGYSESVNQQIKSDITHEPLLGLIDAKCPNKM